MLSHFSHVPLFVTPWTIAHQCNEENKIRWLYSQWWGTEDILAQVSRASQVVLVVKNHLPMQQTLKDVGLIPGSGRSPGEGNGNPLQYSYLENPKDRGVWQVTIHRVTKSRTLLERQHRRGNLSKERQHQLRTELDTQSSFVSTFQAAETSKMLQWESSRCVHKDEGDSRDWDWVNKAGPGEMRAETWAGSRSRGAL